MINTLLDAWTFPAESFNRETDVIKADKVKEVLAEWFKLLKQKYENEDRYTSRDVIRELEFDLNNSCVQRNDQP